MSRSASGRKFSRAVQYLKGRNSHKLLREFAALQKRDRGQYLRARGYRVASSGNVTDAVWLEYIKNQKLPESDDNFEVICVRRMADRSGFQP